VAVAPDLMG